MENNKSLRVKLILLVANIIAFNRLTTIDALQAYFIFKNKHFNFLANTNSTVDSSVARAFFQSISTPSLLEETNIQSVLRWIFLLRFYWNRGENMFQRRSHNLWMLIKIFAKSSRIQQMEYCGIYRIVWIFISNVQCTFIAGDINRFVWVHLVSHGNHSFRCLYNKMFACLQHESKDTELITECDCCESNRMQFVTIKSKAKNI